MIKIKFICPPKTAVICYIMGFVLIAVSMAEFYLNLHWFAEVMRQQIFIAGAITVAIGSLINWIDWALTSGSKEPTHSDKK